MEQIGYSLIDGEGNELSFYGDTVGRCAGVPDFIDLPNGDRVHCPSLDETYKEFRLVPRWFEPGNDESIIFDGEKVIVKRFIPPRTLIPANVFLARATDVEYAAVRAAAEENVLYARWFDLLLTKGEVNVIGATALAAKASMISDGLVSSDRADQIFASM